MVQKLYALAAGECMPDNPDSPMNHEVLLPGHIIQFSLKEKIGDWLALVRDTLNQDIRRNRAVDLRDGTSAVPNARSGTEHGRRGDPSGLTRVLTAAVLRSQCRAPLVTAWRRALGRVSSDLGRKIEYFLGTGNLVSNTGLDLQQVSGFTIVGEKLNFLRYLSHFRSIHRGAFFAEIRTTTVRKLLPDSWGTPPPPLALHDVTCAGVDVVGPVNAPLGGRGAPLR